MHYQTRLSDYHHALPLLGDLPIILGIIRDFRYPSPQDERQFVSLIKFLISLYFIPFSLPMRMFWRFGHGVYTIGFLVGGFALMNMASFSYISFPDNVFSPFVFWFHTPALVFESLGDYVAQNDMNTVPQSMSLFVLAVVFGAMTLVHIIFSYIRMRRDARDIHRGTSWLWWIAKRFSRKLKNKRGSLLWCFLESLITGGAGAYLYFYGADMILGLFLMVSAGCYFLTEVFEVLDSLSAIGSGS